MHFIGIADPCLRTLPSGEKSNCNFLSLWKSGISFKTLHLWVTNSFLGKEHLKTSGLFGSGRTDCQKYHEVEFWRTKVWFVRTNCYLMMLFFSVTMKHSGEHVAPTIPYRKVSCANPFQLQSYSGIRFQKSILIPD